MRRLAMLPLLFLLTAAGGATVSAKAPTGGATTETKYLLFQVWPRMLGYPGIPPLPGHLALSKEQMAEFVRSVVKAVGTTGDTRHKLGFAVGPFCFDMPDEEMRQWIRDAFAVAREDNVAVALHIDDSMSWGRRKDLLANPDNIETADWKQVPNAARSLAWGPKPTEFPPQMCYNAPAIVAAAKDRAALIGEEIKRELAVLKSQGKEHLFAAVIAGSETQISPEFGTHRRLGFRALAHRGFSETNPPKGLDAERVSVVKEWIELWANSLHAGGTPREKIFCHIAFTDQGLRKADAKESYVEKVAFAPPEVAFSSAYRPGFSTYPEGRTFAEVYAALAARGSPGWISAEGTNVSPTSMPGEPNMETYLGRTFNHGGVMVNIFSWGIGGAAQRNNFFRRATENPEALEAYAKFLRGEPLVESIAQGFSGPRFQDKMHRIQAELPGWVQKTGQQAQAMPLIKNIQALVKDRKWQEADKVADELLALMKGDSPAEAKTETLPLSERLPPKIQKIQSALPAWIGSDAGRKEKAAALMKQLQEHLKAKNFEKAEKTADFILEMIGGSAQAASQDIPEEVRSKLTHNLGSSFLVFRDKVQGELKVTKEQKEKLEQHLRKLLPDARQLLQKSKRVKPGEREKYNQQTHAEMAAVLKETLNEGQRTRLRQLEVQREGLFGDGENLKELQVTDEQRKQFAAPIQETQKKTATLMEEIPKGANPDEVRPKVLKLRLDLERELEALLTDAQKIQWKEMLGQPVDLGVLFDGVSSR